MIHSQKKLIIRWTQLCTTKQWQNISVQFPQEIRDAVSELSSPQRWAVFLSILKKDWYFNELRRELGITAEQLDNILGRFVTCGLIFKEMESPAGIGNRKKSRYTVTPAGEKIVRCLLEGFLPESSAPHEREPYPAAGSRNMSRMSVSEPGVTPYHPVRRGPAPARAARPAVGEKIVMSDNKTRTPRAHAEKTPARSPRKISSS